ncbi:MAG TPA: hypothetical protein VLK65_29185 [Vicinamibacteria bacterium]|nr:hypothetical protein [Vicinamibacteria bacterium]
MKRLEDLIPENERKGIAEKEISFALDGLRPISDDLAQGKVYVAFERLAASQDILESAAFLSRHQDVQKPEAFLALWEADGRVLEQEVARLGKAGFSGRSAVVQSRGEISIYRILTHYRASKMYAKVGIGGGLYYLGNAHAAASFASFCARLDDAPQGALPRFRPLAEVEAELSKNTVAAYGQGDAATTHHKNFIRLDSALKEARLLIADHRDLGTVATLLEARFRLGLIQKDPSAPVPVPDTDRAPYRARLFDPAFDHSLALSLWERALDRVASSEDTDRREATVLLEEVIPFYFQLLEE